MIEAVLIFSGFCLALASYRLGVAVGTAKGFNRGFKASESFHKRKVRYERLDSITRI